jgi:hypothetical protein
LEVVLVERNCLLISLGTKEFVSFWKWVRKQLARWHSWLINLKGSNSRLIASLCSNSTTAHLNSINYRNRIFTSVFLIED